MSFWARNVATGQLRTGLTRRQLDLLLTSALWAEWGPMPVPPELTR